MIQFYFNVGGGALGLMESISEGARLKERFKRTRGMEVC
jgi:hypothetical protein